MVTASIVPPWMLGSLGGLGVAMMLLAPLLARRGLRRFGLPRPLERRFYLLRVLGGECNGVAALCLCGSFYLSPAHTEISFLLWAAMVIMWVASIVALARAYSLWQGYKAAQGTQAAGTR